MDITKELFIEHKLFINRNDRLTVSTAYHRILERSPELMECLRIRTSFLGEDAHSYERLFCVLNGLTKQPGCAYCATPIKFSMGKRHYATYCRSCVQKDPSVRDKYSKKMKVVYSDRRATQAPEKPKQNTPIRATAPTPAVVLKKALPYINNAEWLEQESSTKSLDQIASELSVDVAIVRQRFTQFDLAIAPQYESQPERELIEYLTSLGIEVVWHADVFGHTVDVFVPEFNVGIEINEIKTHGELSGKPKQHHHNKTKSLAVHGIRLVHVTDLEWNTKQSIVKSRITTILGLYAQTFYARKCTIVTVDSAVKRAFFVKNHIQGDTQSSYNIGLVHDKRLVCVMSFGKSRFGAQQYELIRFASTLHTSVKGGASKLFSHFLRDINPTSVVSYSDRRYNTGNVYTLLGFNHIHASAPNYSYFDKTIPDVLYSRIVFQKHKLADRLPLFDINKTEWENMVVNGYDRIWDCGNDVFVWTAETIGLS